MKNLKVLAIAFVLGLGFIACESKTTEKETVIVEKEVEAAPVEDKDDDGVSFGIQRDKDGNVGVEVEGKVK